MFIVSEISECRASVCAALGETFARPRFVINVCRRLWKVSENLSRTPVECGEMPGFQVFETVSKQLRQFIAVSSQQSAVSKIHAAKPPNADG